MEAEETSDCCFQRVRIVGSLRRVWHIDPDPESVAAGLAEATVGSASVEWYWRQFAQFQSSGFGDTFLPKGKAPVSPFFQYSSRLGMRIEYTRIGGTLAAVKQSLSKEFQSN